MTKRRDWIKVRKDWWESPSHRLISPGARFFGVFLLYLADSDPDWRETGVGRLLAPDMSPLCSQDVATLSGVSLRNVRRWIEELKRVGTLSELDDGTLCFASYRDHQENRSTKYKRAASDNAERQHKGSTKAAEKKKQKEEGEEEADLTPNPPAGGCPPTGDFGFEHPSAVPAKPAKAKKRKKPKSSYGVDPASVEDTEQVLAWIAKAREWCGFKASKLTATFANRCYVNVPLTILEASMDDWKRVINRQAVKDKDNPEAGRRYLTLSTLCRPDNFNRMLERDDLD